ncbi:hypothetical protein SteCoe_24654 [Stentor coeruleus]|uniref:Uncharacterized protein n=1 Tax=Stentor coeruleus TaxID=5963 RepID=A0A1R2BGZ7_9CILI|nr:hypothetical protein SteCoe_24654 [Stentor coeruleus]
MGACLSNKTKRRTCKNPNGLSNEDSTKKMCLVLNNSNTGTPVNRSKSNRKIALRQPVLQDLMMNKLYASRIQMSVLEKKKTGDELYL